MYHFPQDQTPHFIKPCRDVAFEFKKEGPDVIR